MSEERELLKECLRVFNYDLNDRLEFLERIKEYLDKPEKQPLNRD